MLTRKLSFRKKHVKSTTKIYSIMQIRNPNLLNEAMYSKCVT